MTKTKTKAKSAEVLFASAAVERLEGKKLKVMPLGEPVLSWPEVTLDICP